MGGYGSGRPEGRPTVDESRKVDLAWLLKQGKALESGYQTGTINWSRGGRATGCIGYKLCFCEAGRERLELSYTLGEGVHAENVEQTIDLTFTEPNFGGKRWWMICPYTNQRVAMLFLPPNGDRFASRKAWDLGYRSQRVPPDERAFEALFRLQERLGCESGWGRPIRRPKGMWLRTYENIERQYRELDRICEQAMRSSCAPIWEDIR